MHDVGINIFKHQHLFMWCCITCPYPEPWLWCRPTVESYPHPNRCVQSSGWIFDGPQSVRDAGQTDFHRLALITFINYTWIWNINNVFHQSHNDTHIKSKAASKATILHHNPLSCQYMTTSSVVSFLPHLNFLWWVSMKISISARNLQCTCNLFYTVSQMLWKSSFIKTTAFEKAFEPWTLFFDYLQLRFCEVVYHKVSVMALLDIPKISTAICQPPKPWSNFRDCQQQS